MPPNPGAMGAIGIAMLAAEALAASDEAPRSTCVVCLAAQVTERRQMRCRDKHCANLCRLEAATVDVAGERTKVVSGGNCPKYDDVSGGGRQLPKTPPTRIANVTSY